jgi:transposase
MAVEIVTIDRDTSYLLPPSIHDYLPGDHLARLVVEMVDMLNMRGILGVYAGKGKKLYHPAMLVAVLFYGYGTGTFSGRKLEKATYSTVFSLSSRRPD